MEGYECLLGWNGRVWVRVRVRVGVGVAVGEGEANGVGFGCGRGCRRAFSFGRRVGSVDFVVDLVGFLEVRVRIRVRVRARVGLGRSLRSVSGLGRFDVGLGSICRSIFFVGSLIFDFLQCRLCSVSVTSSVSLGWNLSVKEV